MSNPIEIDGRQALAHRPVPVVKVDDPWIEYSEDDDPFRMEMRQAAERTANDYAALTAGKAAEMIRQIMPAAHRVVVERRETDNSGISIDLMAVYDAAENLIWCDPELGDHPDAAAQCNAEAYGGPVMPRIDSETWKAIEALIEVAEDKGCGYYCVTDITWPSTDKNGEGGESFYPGDLRDFVIDEEIERAANLRADDRRRRNRLRVIAVMDLLLTGVVVVSFAFFLVNLVRGH